jgi:hypothetical protein
LSVESPSKRSDHSTLVFKDPEICCRRQNSQGSSRVQFSPTQPKTGGKPPYRKLLVVLRTFVCKCSHTSPSSPSPTQPGIAEVLNDEGPRSSPSTVMVGHGTHDLRGFHLGACGVFPTVKKPGVQRGRFPNHRPRTTPFCPPTRSECIPLPTETKIASGF